MPADEQEERQPERTGGAVELAAAQGQQGSGGGHEGGEDANDGGVEQHPVVEFKIGRGMAREEPAIGDTHADVEDLVNGNPLLLKGGGDEVEGGQPEGEGGGDQGAEDGPPGAAQEGCGQGGEGEQVAGHDAGGRVGEPGEGEQGGDGEGGEQVEPSRGGRKKGGLGSLPGAVREDDPVVMFGAPCVEEQERDPDGGGEFAEGGAFVGRKQAVGGAGSKNAGQVGLRRMEELAGQCVGGEAGGGEDEEGENGGDVIPLRQIAEQGSHDPGDRRVENEAGFAGAPIGALRPVGVEDVLGPGALGFHPGDEVEVEVVAAGDAAQEAGSGGNGGGERNEGPVAEGGGRPGRRGRAAGEGTRWGGIHSGHVRWQKFIQGNRVRVWVVCVATAAGEKGSGKVVPEYQKGH